MIEGWKDFPPTNLLVKAIVDGFGGLKAKDAEGGDSDFVVPQRAHDAMQSSAVAAISAKADPRWFPVQRGKDKGLPKVEPVFDLTKLRDRDAAARVARAVRSRKGV